MIHSLVVKQKIIHQKGQNSVLIISLEYISNTRGLNLPNTMTQYLLNANIVPFYLHYFKFNFKQMHIIAQNNQTDII